MRFMFTFFMALSWSIGVTQITQEIDSLKHKLNFAKQDTNQVLTLLRLSTEYYLSNIDSSIMYGQKALILAKHIQFSIGEMRALNRLGSSYRLLGEIPKGLELIYKALQIANDKQDSSEIEFIYSNIGLIHFDLDEYLKSIDNFQTALKISKAIRDETRQVYLLIRIGYAYSKNNQLDSAENYMQKAYNKWKTIKVSDNFNALFFELLGDIQFRLGNQRLAFDYLQKSIEINQKNNFLLTGAIAHIMIAGFFKEIGQIDSAIYNAKAWLKQKHVVLKKEYWRQAVY